jgi:hypothetical protein
VADHELSMTDNDVAALFPTVLNVEMVIPRCTKEQIIIKCV